MFPKKEHAAPRLAPSTRSDRRQRLIDAAWRCIADRGFQGLTVDDVCAEAGVSKGAFYVYFTQKQDLLTTLVHDEANGVEEAMIRLEETYASGVERLRRFARAMVESGDDPARLQLHADLWAEMSSSPSVGHSWAAVVHRRRAILRRWVEESIRAGELAPIPANALAAVVLALGDGLLLHAGLDPGGFRWANIGKALDKLLDGISV